MFVVHRPCFSLSRWKPSLVCCAFWQLVVFSFPINSNNSWTSDFISVMPVKRLTTANTDILFDLQSQRKYNERLEKCVVVWDQREVFCLEDMGWKIDNFWLDLESIRDGKKGFSVDPPVQPCWRRIELVGRSFTFRAGTDTAREQILPTEML